MCNRRIIGKIQLIIGIILFLVTIVSSIFIVKSFYIETLVEGIESSTRTWGEVNTGQMTKEELKSGMEIETNEITGHVVDSVIIQGEIIKTTGVVFLTLSFVLVILALMFVLQGLANLGEK